jgi:hypothetical protein
MADRIRGEEVSLQVVLDGVLQAGSFTKVENFKFSPLTDISQSSFLGESEDEFDLQHHGYDMSFTIQSMDNAAVDNILMPLVSALKAGDVLPNVQLIAITRYRDPSLPIKTNTFKTVKLKLDSSDSTGRKEYIKSSFSGKCREMVSR